MASPTPSAVVPGVTGVAPLGPPAPKGHVGWRRFVRDVAAGTAGGIVVTFVGHPFDTLKTLLQTQNPANPMYKGMLDAARKTITQHGILGLYRGVSSPLCGQIFFRACLFSSYGQAKVFFNASPDRPWTYAAAGAVGWGVASLIEGPIDLFKTQLQFQLIKQRQVPGYVSPYRGLLDVIRTTFGRAPDATNHKGSGIFGPARGPHQGLWATLVRNVPAAAVYFCVFENLTAYFARKQGGKPDFWYVMFAGGFAGVCYWAPIYPVDVIKGAMMADSPYKDTRVYKGWMDCARKLYAEGGVGRFYRGFTPCMVRSVPANACMLTTSYFARRLLGLDN